jgi:vacuolar-type H+-ATPase subunit E/Vma4
VNDPKSIIDAQVQHLLNVVEDHRATRYEEIQEQAQKNAHAIISKAHKDARQRMHDDNVETRENANRQLASTEAQLQTQQRLARQQSDEKLLQASWKLLKASLERQWQQPDIRKQWVDNLTRQALATLVSPHWRIEHPADWADEECIALQMQLHEQLDHTPELEPVTDISAGLRLCAEGTCVDGTADGLMHERTRIEALMLAAIHQHGDADHV